MYNAGRQYGLGADKQRRIRDRTKSIMGRYGAVPSFKNDGGVG